MSGGTVSPSGYCPGRHFPLAIVSRRQFLRGTLAIRCDTCSENYVELVFICVLLCEGQCAYDIVHQIVSYCPFICLKSTQRWTGGRGVEGGNPLSKNDEKQRHLFTMSRKRLTMIVRLASEAGNSACVIPTACFPVRCSIAERGSMFLPSQRNKGMGRR